MRNIFIKSVVGFSLLASMASCGDKFLETEYYNGVDVDGGLSNVDNVGYALNGTYYQFQYFYFASNYATLLGDLASDITYWTTKNAHQNSLYQFSYTDTDVTLYYIWDYGYKVIDNAARVINAAEELLPESEGYDTVYLMLYEAEARCLRAYANLALVNTFAHQVMVDGTSYANQPGLVIVDTPIQPFSQVSRSTVGETYDFILEDLETAIQYFEAIGGDRGSVNYFGEAAANGLLARTQMYLENWQEAIEAAEYAISLSGIDSLTYTVEGYYQLYSTGSSNIESMFELGINSNTFFYANSSGTLFTTYGYSCSPYLLSLYGENDCRLPLISEFDVEDTEDPDTGEIIPGSAYNDNYVGGKFYFGYGDTQKANNFLINAPEMYLIAAEGYANIGGHTIDAQDALYIVAHRNPDIASPSDLPSTDAEILEFLHDERARELFQEGFRFFDLRRWNLKANLYATGAPEIKWRITNAEMGNIVLPIPADEINAGYGVTQNEGWQNTQPKGSAE